MNSDSLDTVRYVTLVYRTHQGYFQDDWKVTPKLTMNFGVRVDYNHRPAYRRRPVERLSLTTANPGAGGRPGAIVFAGTGRPGRRPTR